MGKRKVNWRKGLLKTSFMITIALIFSLGVGLISNAANAGKDIQFIQVTVKPGDSLWLIADRYDDNKTDLRKLIYQIKQINNINDTIYPGQVLEIPLHN
ncbi:MAG: hypothetical protein PWQ67_2308 [Clostridia bacterium]|jgi:hypothetical protein|nr:hypothetical protein [Clostridia bacterium]